MAGQPTASTSVRTSTSQVPAAGPVSGKSPTPRTSETRRGGADDVGFHPAVPGPSSEFEAVSEAVAASGKHLTPLSPRDPDAGEVELTMQDLTPLLLCPRPTSQPCPRPSLPLVSP